MRSSIVFFPTEAYFSSPEKLLAAFSTPYTLSEEIGLIQEDPCFSTFKELRD